MSRHSGLVLLVAACVALSLHPASGFPAQNNGSPSFEQSYDHGIELLRGGKPLEAFRVFDEGPKGDPQKARLLNAAGSALLLLNRVQDAACYFRRAIATQPYLIAARKNLGISLWTSGKVNESRKQFELALIESPKDTTTYLFIEFAVSFNADLIVHIHPPDRRALEKTSLGVLQPDRVVLPASLFVGKKSITIDVS